MRVVFGLAGINNRPARVNLKCDPGLARDLRGRYASVLPGYHMNKDHWNTVVTGGDISDDKVRELVDLSYDLVVAKLPKKVRASL